ncbi:MAG: hypothetical protein WAV51_04010 [Microgenomates group bacterium]
MTKHINNTESLLNSEEYNRELSSTLISILKKTNSAVTEATVASIFENELYHFLKSFFNKDIIFEKEIGESAFRHKFNGRLDAISNSLIIEYKRKSKLDKSIDQEKATTQVINYLQQLKTEQNNQFYAILTDGVKIRYFYYQNGILHFTPFKTIDTNDLDRLIKSLLIVDYKQFVPENIIKDFKFNSLNSCTHKLANCLFRFLETNMTEKTNMLFQEWEVLFHLSESDQGQNSDIVKRRLVLNKIFNTKILDNNKDYKALFALQTTYAIIVKLIACKVISKLTFNNEIMYFSDLTTIDSEKLRAFFEKVEDGYDFATGGIRNLLEGDFFSWYCTFEQWNEEEAKIFIEIINILEGYANTSFKYGYATIDIFKDLYMEIMPNEVRHSLGEYFTPAWLADYVVKESINSIQKKEWRAIDPCCGSGIFIISLIKSIIGNTDIISLDNNQKKTLLKKILTRVEGIDINPLSVLTARVSYLFAIAPLIENTKFEIPIYLGDSANIPKIISLDGVECYEYKINTKQGDIDSILPCSFVHNSNFIEKMSLLQTTIKIKDPNIVYDKIVSNFPKSDCNKSVSQAINRFSKQLVSLSINNWDGIWIRIVMNFMLIARIHNIDIIVGNPPWVKWEFLPQSYAENIKALCISRHLFSGQTYMGAISLNICALIANVTASTWLNEEGILAFLMPKTLMTQDSYAGFRNFYLDLDKHRMYLQKVDDWSWSGNPFIYTTEKFLTYYYKKTAIDYFNGIPVKNIIKNKSVDIKNINRLNDFDSVKKYFQLSFGNAYQLDSQRTGFTLFKENNVNLLKQFIKIIGECAYKARSGVEFTPAEVYFIEPQKESSEAGLYIFNNSVFKNSKYKADKNNGIKLETNYIRPVIKSPYITSYKILSSNNYCIFPYNDNSCTSVNLTELNANNEYLADYFIKQKNIIQKQSKRSLTISKGTDFYSLSKVGQYTFANHLVTFRDNTKLVAAVVSKIKTPWGETKMPICAKHSPYISMDKNNRYITEDEAHYICGILNTALVQEYFKCTFSTRSYSIDFNIKIPLFDPKNALQQKISSLAKQAINTKTNILSLNLEIENLYIQLCEHTNK